MYSLFMACGTPLPSFTTPYKVLSLPCTACQESLGERRDAVLLLMYR